MSETRLFINRRWITETRDVEVKLAPHRIHDGAITIDGEERWCPELGHNHVSWYRDEAGVYHGWRTTRIDDHERLAGKGGDYRIRSKDGITWETTGGPTRIATVLFDANETDPQRKYKGMYHGSAVLDDAGNVEISWEEHEKLIAAAKAGRAVSTGMYSAVSGDGLSWHDHRLIVKEEYAHQNWNPAADLGHNPDMDKGVKHNWWKPGAPGWSGGDNFPCLTWDPKRKKYVAFYRTNIDRSNQFYPGRQRRERGTGRSECETFGEWGPHHLAMRAEPTWQRLMGYGAFDYYQLQVWPCADVWLGVVSIFHWGPDTIHLELVWSPDTIHWERVSPGTDIVPMDISEGSPSRGGHYACMAPQEIDGEVRMYLGTSAGLHNAEGSGDAWMWLAYFKPGRFAGLGAKCGKGLVTTAAIEIDGAISLNVDASRGRVRYGLLDEAGKPVAGFGAEDCKPITIDSSDAKLQWRNALPKGKYSLVLELENAVAYALTT